MSDVAYQTEPAPMNEFSRLSGVFFEPGKTFTDIAERPRWIVPVLISVVMAFAFLYIFSTHIGWEPYMHRIMDNNPRMAQLPEDQRQRTFDMQLKIVPIFSYVSVVILLPLYYILGAAIIMGLAKSLIGAPLRFKQMFAIMCYASLPRAILSVLGIAVMFATKNPENFDLNNPFFSNPGAFMDPEHSSAFLRTLASSIDVFAIWVILLIATGIKAAGGKRVTFGGALMCVLIPYVLVTVIRAGLAAAGIGAA
jgi:hypothetical protein